jgi:hypothetical protein
MTDTTTLLRQALDLLTPIYGESANICTAIRAHLAQPQAEPVAEFVYVGQVGRDLEDFFCGFTRGTEFFTHPAAPVPNPNVCPFERAEADAIRKHLAPVPADPTMTRDELVAAAESIGMRFPAPVPGYVLVPVEPFPSQRIAGVVALIRASQRDFEPTTDEIAAVYRAMITAAPGAKE